MLPTVTDQRQAMKNKNGNQISESIVNKMKRTFVKGEDCSISASNLFDFLHVWSYHDFVFENLGEGFFGTVFKVTHKITKQVFVLKELKTASDEDHKAMFIDEIKTLSRLCHPNVLKCEGMALHGDNLCLLTEFIDGGSLDEMLMRKNPLLSNWEAKVNISMDIARGMTYLHSVGVIHRDLTSKNILIRQRLNGRLQGIIADFGLSHTINNLIVSEEEYALDTVGSPYHMAPEVLNHKPYNTKADVFSYGIILCEMITMCPGADPDDLPRSNDFGLAVADFFEMASDCPSEVLDLTVRCCQVNPRDRPTFVKIVKTLDAMLDVMKNRNIRGLNENGSLDVETAGTTENGLNCECKYDHKKVGERLDEITEMRKCTSSIDHDIESKEWLNQPAKSCAACEGRMLTPQKALQIQENDIVRNDLVRIEDSSVKQTPDDKSSPLGDSSTPGKNVDGSNEAFAEEITQLAKNTPGKLPRFFQYLLRSKIAKIRPKDVKRRWRKSLHDIFSLQASNYDEKTINPINVLDVTRSECHSQKDALTTGKHLDGHFQAPVSDSKRGKCSNKAEKYRKDSKSRKKSFQKSETDAERVLLDQVDKRKSTMPLETKQGVNGYDVEKCPSFDSLDNCHSPSIERHRIPLRHSVAVSIDSLDRLSLSDDHKHRNRRNSMPARKTRHGRTQSSEGSKPPLRKQSSGSSKLLSFLRRKSHTSPRD